MAHTFRDTNGRLWAVTVTIGTARRVRSLTSVDLLALIDNPTELAALAADPVRLVDLLYAVVKPEADLAGITDEAFGESLAGDSIDAATSALLEALIDFFPEARRRILRRITDRATQALDTTRTQLAELIDSGKLDQLIDQALTAGPTSGDSPDPSGSIPAPSPSPNSSPSPTPTAAPPGTTPPPL